MDNRRIEILIEPRTGTRVTPRNARILRVRFDVGVRRSVRGLRDFFDQCSVGNSLLFHSVESFCPLGLKAYGRRGIARIDPVAGGDLR